MNNDDHILLGLIIVGIGLLIVIIASQQVGVLTAAAGALYALVAQINELINGNDD